MSTTDRGQPRVLSRNAMIIVLPSVAVLSVLLALGVLNGWQAALGYLGIFAYLGGRRLGRHLLLKYPPAAR